MSDQTHGTAPSVAVTVVSYFLSMLFLFVGLAKLWGPQMVGEQFAAWNLPPDLMYTVGGIEVTAGFLLLMPSARGVGALLLALIMIGAGVTHFFAQQFAAIAAPAMLFALLAWIMTQSTLAIEDPMEPDHGPQHKEAAAH
jgi:putative oxidoreductase